MDGKLSYKGATQNFTKPLQEGNIIGCGVVFRTSEVFFTINGKLI